MNTKTQQDQKKNQGRKARQGEGTEKRGQNLTILHNNRKREDHEQEHPETRLTR